jgi:hypothetical protein
LNFKIGERIDLQNADNQAGNQPLSESERGLLIDNQVDIENNKLF